MFLETKGLHPATELCFLALKTLQNTPNLPLLDPISAPILDMGCGNGILSVLCAHLWEGPILAADISPQAVQDTGQKLAEQGLHGRVQVLRSDGFSHPGIQAGGPYGLILINLLAEPILAWAPQVKKSVQLGGYVYLGGILQWQREEIARAYTALGFEIAEEFGNSPWVGLLLCHKSDTKKPAHVTKP